MLKFYKSEKLGENFVKNSVKVKFRSNFLSERDVSYLDSPEKAPSQLLVFKYILILNYQVFD